MYIHCLKVQLNTQCMYVVHEVLGSIVLCVCLCVCVCVCVCVCE